MPRNRNRLAAAVTVAAIAGGGAGAGAVALTHGSSHGTPTAVASPSASNVASASLTVGQIAKASIPSVVEVDATEGASQSPFPGGSQGGGTAQGTGFVYDSKGDIVTNDHVISGSSSVSVKLSDGSSYKATVVGSDPSSDLAVLHIDAPASKLVPLALADRARSRSVTGSSRSATRSASTARSRPASSAPSTARSRRPTTRRSKARSRPTLRSTTGTPAVRCSTCRAR